MDVTSNRHDIAVTGLSFGQNQFEQKPTAARWFALWRRSTDRWCSRASSSASSSAYNFVGGLLELLLAMHLKPNAIFGSKVRAPGQARLQQCPIACSAPCSGSSSTRCRVRTHRL